MTAVVDRSVDSAHTPTWAIGAPRLLAGLDRHAVLDHRTHLDVHGALPGCDLPRLLTLLDASGLAGRGGAGFPLAAKLRALHGQRPTVVVNGTESEPASLKDRVLLRRSPHLVVDGALAVAAALGARRVTIAVHDHLAAQAVRGALGQRPDGSHVRVEQVGGGFVAGEARALVRALAGGPAPAAGAARTRHRQGHPRRQRRDVRAAGRPACGWAGGASRTPGRAPSRARPC